MVTQEQIQAAYGALMHAKRSYAAEVTAEVEAERALEDARLRAIAEGRIAGKDDLERAALAQGLLAGLIAAQRTAQDRARAARLELDLATLEVEALRTGLRLMELEAGMEE